MEALFIIPTMISPSVNDRLVPAICKLVERNIALTNSAVIRAAVMKKYLGVVSGLYKTARSEGTELNENATQQKFDQDQEKIDLTRQKQQFDMIKVSAEKAGEMLDRGGLGAPANDKKTLAATDQIELPNGLTFFHTISLEPTYMIFNLNVKSGMLMGTSQKQVTIGFKAVPYKVDNVDDIVSMMGNMKSFGLVRRFLERYKNEILNKILIFSKRWWAYKGEKQGDATDIIYAPSSYQLSSPSYLSGLMSARKGKAWSTMVVLSTFDFKEEDLKNTLMQYRHLVQAGWGDLVVMNDSKESVHFCTSKMGACFELPYTYMKQVLNLSNVLDYSEVSRWSRPMHVSSVANAFSESGDFIPDSEDTKAMMMEIIKS